LAWSTGEPALDAAPRRAASWCAMSLAAAHQLSSHELGDACLVLRARHI
jgi:hypothetical protein